MSSNPQGGSWFSDDKPKLEPEPPFGGEPTRVQAKKAYIPDDWEDDDGEEDEGQTGPILPLTRLQPEPEMDPPAQSQEGRGGEKIKPLIAANSMASPIAKKRAPPAAPYGDSGPSLPSFEPVVQILKRSTNPTGGATPTPIAASSQKPLVEREREYQQARQRIFGSTSDGAISSSDNIPKDSDVPSVVQRQPQGPSSEDAVGFRGRSNRM